MNAERIKHRATGHHWRHNLRRRPTSLAICSCGWQCWSFRRIHWITRLRGLLCIVPGHDWEASAPIHAGPLDFEESDETLLGHMRQCARCYRCEVTR